MDKLLALLARYQTLLALVLLAPLTADAFLRLTGYADGGLGLHPHALEAIAFAAGVMGVKRPSDTAKRLAQIGVDALQSAKVLTDEEIGATAFEAYVSSVSGMTHDGKPIPRWPDLSDAVRAAWTAAGKAVRS